jgi:D-lyxose ketol-isomerase
MYRYKDKSRVLDTDDECPNMYIVKTDDAKTHTVSVKEQVVIHIGNAICCEPKTYHAS